MIPYLLHSSILLAGCFTFYWLFIRKETFFKLNRWVLISGILLSVSIPLIHIPEDWSLRKASIQNTERSAISETLDAPITIPKKKTKETISEINLKNKSEHQIISSPTLPTTADPQQLLLEKIFFGDFVFISAILWYIYLVGVVIFFLAFMIQLIILIAKMYTYISYKDGRYRIVELVKDEAPYSFWNSIFINPTRYDLETYTQIINHEKIHIRQAHFFDKILSEIVLIAFWFNPFVWFYRNAVTNNLEYLTDSSMLDEGVEKQIYQLSLLKVSVPQHPLNLSTNYNNSFLKNRIAMMNSKKSSARSSWKYMFLLPLIGFSVISMNAVTSSEKNFQSITETSNQTEQDTSPVTVVTSINSSINNTLNKPSKITTTRPLTTTTTIRTVTTTEDNSNPETRSTTSNKKSTYSEYDPQILEDLHSIEWHQDIKPKHWTAEIKSNRVCFEFNHSNPDQDWTWMTSECFDKSELSEIPTTGDKEFYIKRVAGTMTFKGSFAGDFGDGSFSFKSDNSFKSYLSTQGIEIKNDDKMIHLFMNNVDKDYISFLKSKNLKVDGRDLVELSAHNVDKDDINDYVKIFNDLDYKGYNVRDLIHFDIHDVNPEYVNEIRAQGITDLSVEQVVQAKIHDVEPSFIKEVKDYGFKDISLQDIIQFSIHDVDVEYIQQMKNLGFRNLSHNEIVQSSIHDVDPAYIKSIHEAGYTNMKMNDLVQFAIHDIDAKYIKGFEEAGIDNISQQDIIQAGIHDVDVRFVKELKAYGMTDLRMNEIVQLAIHDVDVEYLKEMKSLGFRNLSNQEITQAKIHDVDPDYIRALQAEGMLEGLEMNEIVQFAIHDIKASDIKAFKAAGFDFSHQDIIQAGIHDVSAKYINAMRGLGFENEELEGFIQAKIHGVNPSFIKRARAKGHNPETLREYVRLKNVGMD